MKYAGASMLPFDCGIPLSLTEQYPKGTIMFGVDYQQGEKLHLLVDGYVFGLPEKHDLPRRGGKSPDIIKQIELGGTATDEGDDREVNLRKVNANMHPTFLIPSNCRIPLDLIDMSQYGTIVHLVDDQNALYIRPITASFVLRIPREYDLPRDDKRPHTSWQNKLGGDMKELLKESKLIKPTNTFLIPDSCNERVCRFHMLPKGTLIHKVGYRKGEKLHSIYESYVVGFPETNKMFGFPNTHQKVPTISTQIKPGGTATEEKHNAE